MFPSFWNALNNGFQTAMYYFSDWFGLNDLFIEVDGAVSLIKTIGNVFVDFIDFAAPVFTSGLLF